MLLPHFIIIGAMKSGTTSLHNYLKKHPKINMSRDKETDFFLDKNFSIQNLESYVAQFEETDQIRGETSPNYTKFPILKNIPSRIFSVVPEVRLIYLVRDPLDRLVSHYQHALVHGRESRAIDGLWEDIENTLFFHASRYHYQVLQYLSFFKKEKFYYLTTETLAENPEEAMKSVYAFLGVENFEIPEKYRIRFNVTESEKNKRKKQGLLDEKKLANLNSVNAYLSYNSKEKYAYFKERNKKAFDVLKEDIARFRDLTQNPCSHWII